VHQVGSHIILETSEPTHQRIAIPDHDPVRPGTLISIFRAIAQHKGVTHDAIIATCRPSENTSRLSIPTSSLLANLPKTLAG